MYDTIIAVEVGPDDRKKKNFQLYRGLICFHSAYFNKLIHGTFKDSGSDHIKIKTVEVDIFEHIFFWLNSGKLYVPRSEKVVPLSFKTIAEIYVFADTHIIPRLKNAAVEACVEKMYVLWNTYIRGDVVEYLYENTSSNCAMRAIMVKDRVDRSRWTDTEELPNEFLIDVIRFIQDKKGYINHARDRDSTHREQWFKDIKSNICQYHDHIEPNANLSRLENSKPGSIKEA